MLKIIGETVWIGKEKLGGLWRMMMLFNDTAIQEEQCQATFAFLSSVLSDVIPLTLPGECFLAGLLHDVGRIVFFGMDNARFLFIDTTATMFDQELAAFGCTHADAADVVSAGEKLLAARPEIWAMFSTR